MNNIIILFIRSSIFNFAFYAATILMCGAALPILFLSRKQTMKLVAVFVHTVHFLEKYVLGLHYEVRGGENIPQEGAYIVAAKHYSPYETFKLSILFKDPAIVLKKELLRIPLWGPFLGKTEPIAIDRRAGKKAVQQVIEGARHIKEQGRPIVIFPQGTRVWPHETPQDKPYKVGIARMQEATQLPIIPLALNTGAFWPRHSWIKKPGTVVFKFLPPIEAGKSTADLMATLEEQLEQESQILMEEAGK